MTALLNGRLQTLSGHVLTDDEMNLAERIYDLRKQSGMTQAELAEKCQCGRTTIVNIEGGHQGVTMPMFFAIAKAFRCPPWELLIQRPSGGG